MKQERRWRRYAKKIDGYKDMVKQLVDMAQQLRDDRAQLMKLIGDQSKIIERSYGMLARVDKHLP